MLVWLHALTKHLGRLLGGPPNALRPAFAHAFAAPVNELPGAPVHRIESGGDEDLATPSPRTTDRKDPMALVAVMANRIPGADSADDAVPARAPAPRMVPLSKKRQDAAARMRSIEQREADADIVRRVQGGESDLYRFLVQKYQQKVYGVVYGMVQNPEDAREITQDAFIKAFRSLPRFRLDSSFYTWLYRISVNLSIDFRRRASKRWADEFDDSRMQKDEAGGASHAHVESSPSRRLERKRLADHIQWAIDQLPTDQRTAIMLREVEGLSYKEIALAMECAEGTVMSRLFYGRKKLQEILRDVHQREG